MAAPDRHNEILQPPEPGMHLLLDKKDEFYRFTYALWKRTGGYNSSISNMQGLQASVAELNTLVGIDTNNNNTVQKQLDLKADISSLGTIASQDANSVNITGGLLDGVTISDSSISGGNITDANISFEVGSSGVSIPPAGNLHSDVTSASNSGALETNLLSYSLPANSLITTGSYYQISAFGVVAANGNNKRIRLKYGATTLIDTGTIAANSGSWEITATIIRTGSSAQKIITKIVSSNALIVDSATYVTAAENLSTAITLVCTGQGVSNGDITQEGLLIKYFNV